MTEAIQKMNALKTISYGDPKAQILLWQKSILLVPIWGIFALPVVGFICHSVNNTAVRAGFGLMMAFFIVYFINDVLKRKITFDDQHLYFGFETMPIKDINSIEVIYKKNKFLPTDIVLNSISGRNMRFGLNGLTDKNVDVLVKHLQTNNSTLETATVLATLVKCRRTREKPPESARRLELPLHSRRALVQTIDTYKDSAAKWMRLGPIVSLGIFVPCWSLFVSALYVCLQPYNLMQLQQLGGDSFMYKAAVGFLTAVSNLSTDAYMSSRPLIENPVVLIAEMVFFAVLLFCAQRLFFQANSLVADNEGIKLFLRCGPLSVPLKRLIWSDISRLSFDRDNAKFANIRFVKNNGKKVEMDVESLSPEHRALLLKRVEKCAPECQIDQSLSEIMRPKANQSYTEIWLQSLNQSPERATLDPLSPGQLVGCGRFEILRKIGVGGQGTAYLCRDLQEENEPFVVLKETIIPVFANNATTLRELQKFEREAKILQDLKHPGVVSLMRYFVEDHRAYLVLEHIDGLSLSEIVKRDGALPEVQVRDLAVQMVEILEFLHSHGVVHRDFTPDNLLLNSQGRLKLIDFNVAQKGDCGVTGTIVGKHAYLPPEQFRGKATARSDIYAFGATLFFLLTGQDPEPISQSCPANLNSDVSQVLNEIVKKATALKEENRFNEIDEVKIALAEDEHHG